MSRIVVYHRDAGAYLSALRALAPHADARGTSDAQALRHESAQIAAHGDGTTAETRHLTQLRADAVRRYLISKGVSLQRVTARGYGSDQRLTGGTDAAAQSRNRRIELRVLSAAPGR